MTTWSKSNTGISRDASPILYGVDFGTSAADYKPLLEKSGSAISLSAQIALQKALNAAGGVMQTTLPASGIVWNNGGVLTFSNGKNPSPELAQFAVLATTIAATTMPASMYRFVTNGYASAKDFGRGGTYVRAVTGGGPGAVQDASGAWWQIDVSAPGYGPHWFGAKGDGVTDDTAAIQAALTAGTNIFFPTPAASYLISAALLVNSNSVLLGQSSTISTATHDIPIIYGTGVHNVVVSGLRLVQTSAGAAAYIGGVEFYNSTYCRITNCDFEGMQWSGAMLRDSSYCSIDNNYFGPVTATGIADVNDICLLNDCSSNSVVNNTCFGGTNALHGILIQQISGSFGTNNSIIGNTVGPHSAYGIINYFNTASANAFNTISRNHIYGITGTALGGNSGAGIYTIAVAGNTISENTIRNCALSTSNLTLNPAAIAIGPGVGSLAATVVSNNNISDMGGYFGISVVGQGTSPVNIVGNTITFSAGTLGQIGIRVNNTSNVSIRDNIVNIHPSIPTTAGILVFATVNNISGISISGNQLLGFSSNALQVYNAAAYTISNLIVSNNTISDGTSNAVPIHLAAIVGAVISDNIISSLGTYAMILQGTNMRVSGNSMIVSGFTLAVQTLGTCTGSLFDESNSYSGLNSYNSGIGCILGQLANAAPTAGNAMVGDYVKQSVPVVGQPKGWRCTVTGSPGTWVSEGNL